MNIDPSILTVIISVVGSVLVNTLTNYFTYRGQKNAQLANKPITDSIADKNNADTTATIQKAAGDAVTMLRGEMDKLRNQIERQDKVIANLENRLEIVNEKYAHLEIEMGKWKSWAHRLCSQLRDNRIDPVPFEID